MDQRGAVWAVALPLIAFKLWVIILLLIYAPTPYGFESIIATQWPTALVLALLVAGPALFWLRLVRARARREQLRRSEWMLADPPRAGRRRRQGGAGDPQWSVWEALSRLEGRD